MSFCTIKTVNNGTNIHSTSLAIRIEHGDAENGNEFWSQKIDSHRFFNLIVCDRTCAFWLQIGLWSNLYRGFWLLRCTNIQNWFGHSCAWGDHVRRNLQHDSAIARDLFWVQQKKHLLKRVPLTKGNYWPKKPGCWNLWKTEPCEKKQPLTKDKVGKDNLWKTEH